MNAVDINRVEVNRVRVNMCTVNSFAARKAKVGRRLTPIASYRCYDKTNDDADRNVLTDLTGNGHDIQLYNFEFAESSGYGKYATDFTKWTNQTADSVFKNKFIFTKSTNGAGFIIYLKGNFKISSFKIKVSGLTKNNDYVTYRYYEENNIKAYKIETNGIHVLPATDGTSSIGFLSYNLQSEITIEQIPDYKGALVSDGVDDYGLCENFPILTKERGYTVCAIRKLLENKVSGILKVTMTSSFAYIERLEANGVYFTYSYLNQTNIDDSIKTNWFVQKSNKYNDKDIKTGDNTTSDNLKLFALNTDYTKIALYALEIYDRDLTDEEIAKVKARMIAEYEEKTGNKYEEETA